MSDPAAPASFGSLAFALAQLSRFGWLLGAVLIATLFAAIASVLSVGAVQSVGIIALATLVGLAGGGGLGFIFGIPKAGPQNTAPPNANGQPASASTMRPNTNLEEVSDWVSKIIVGVGLAQLYVLQNEFTAFQAMLAAYSRPHVSVTPLASTFGLIIGLLVGFLWLYLETRTFITKAISDFQGELAKNLTLALAKVTEELPQEEVALVPAADSLKQAAQLNPQDDSLRNTAAKALAAAGRNDEAWSLLAANKNPSVEDKINQMLVSLYQPGGYADAIKLGKSLANEQAARNSVDYWVYLAAAYGQKHYALSNQKPPDDAALSDAKENVIAAAKAAVALDASAKERLLRLTNPDKKPNDPDDDLEDFRGDAEFLAIVR